MFSQNLGAVVNVGAQARGRGWWWWWWGEMVKGTLCIFMNIEKMGPDFRKITLIVFIYV